MRRAKGSISITIGRFGSDPEQYDLAKDSTVKEALEEAGISLESAEKVWVNGDRANSRDILEEGDVINVVTPKEAGAK